MANFSYQVIETPGDAIGPNGDAYRFTPSGVGGSETLSWNFGDGNTGTSTGTASKDHTYSLGGVAAGQQTTVTMTRPNFGNSDWQAGTNGDVMGGTVTVNASPTPARETVRVGYDTLQNFPDYPGQGGSFRLIAATTYTYTFSTAVKNPKLAIYSLGNNTGSTETLTFSQTPVDASGGASVNTSNYAAATKITVNGSGKSASGAEGFGIVQFIGTFTTISVTKSGPENYANIAWGMPGDEVVSKTFDNYYIAMGVPDYNQVITSIPVPLEAAVYKNNQPDSNRNVTWYIYENGETLNKSGGTVATGYATTATQYNNGASKSGLVDGLYYARCEDASAGIAMEHPFQLGASPAITIANISANSTINSDKIVTARATDANGNDISSGISWTLKRASNNATISTATGPSLFLTDITAFGVAYNFYVSVTNSNTTVNDSVLNVTVNEVPPPESDLTENTLYLHPIQKSVGRALYQNSWRPLFDDMSDGGRRGYGAAVGGGIITGGANVNFGKAESSTSSSLYNQDMDALKSLKQMYLWYKNYIYSHAGDGQAGPSTNNASDFSNQTANNFKLSELLRATLSCFYVKVNNDTSGTTYNTDGNGSVSIVVNMGTGSFDIGMSWTDGRGTFNETSTGVTNNSGMTGSNIEGGTEVQCSVIAKHGSTEATKSTFKVTLGRGANTWSIVYKSTTHNIANGTPAFFYSGSESVNPNRAAQYGAP